MIEGSSDASMAKIKRQLQFDSAPRQQLKTEKHLLIIPQSLQMLLNSSHGPEMDNYVDQDLSAGKKTPIVQRKQFEKHYMAKENQPAFAQESYCNASPFSNKNKVIITKPQEKNDVPNVEQHGANLKMNSLSQLNHLKAFITQKQYNESILQFQIPIKKMKREQSDELENQNNFMQVRSHQGFTTEEKKVIYNSEYLQRLGLPIPESVVKQKLFQKENEVNRQAASSTIVQKEKVVLNNNKNVNQSQLLQSKDISFRAPNQIERKEKVILGIRGMPQKENDKQKGLNEIIKNEGMQESNVITKQIMNQQFPLQQCDGNVRNQHQLIKLARGQHNNKKDFASLNQREVRNTKEQQQKIATSNNENQKMQKQIPGQELEYRKIGQLGEQKKNKIIEKLEQKQGHLMDRFRKETAAQGEMVVPDLQLKTLDANEKMEQEQENQMDKFKKEKSGDSTSQEPQIRRLLTENEKNTMVVAWVKKNLQDLNYWIQKSKSSLNVEFSEEKGQFKCTLSLSTTQKKDIIRVSSKSNSKKDARKNVMKKLAQKVIMDDQLFWEGVTGRQYVETILKEFQEAKDSIEGDIILKSIFADEGEMKQEKDKQLQQQRVFETKKREEKDRGDQDKFKVSKLIRQMQNFLKEDKVIEALEKLSSIAALEVEITFKEASFIWNYAIQKENLILLKIILDVIHYRKFSPQMLQTLNLQQTHPEQAMSELLGQFSQAPSSRRLKNVNDILKKCLCVQRTLLTVNPFEQINDKLQNQQSSTPSQDQPKQTQINPETFSILNSLSQVESLNFLSENKMTKQNSNSMDFEQSQPSDWPAQSFQKEKNLTFDKTGIILSQALLRKDPYLHYLEWDDLNQLFYSLLLTSNPIFALQACELIYTYAKINPDSLQGFSFFYFLYKKLILFEEFIEATIQPSHQLDRPRPQRKQGILLVQGSIEYLGSNSEQDQFMFKVTKETGEICTSASRLIQEGDLCTISLFNNSDVSINYQEATSCIIKECFLNDNIQYFKINMVLLNDQSKRSNYLKADTSKLYCLCKISSTKKLLTESKALDSICSKVSMLHSIFQKITLGDGYSNYQEPVRVVQEINLQQLAEVHSLNEELLKTLRLASTNDLTIIQGTHNSRKTELAICITRQWLQQSNLKILVKCDSETKSKQFFTQLHYFILKQQNHMTASSVIPFCSNVCLLLEDNSAESYSSTSKNISNMSSSMSLKIKRRLEESQIIVVSNVENMVPLKDCQFNRVILLNAEQMPEQITWQFLVRNCNQLTLIGDITTFKRQSTQSLLSKSRRGDCSLFERLISSGIKPIILKNRYIPPSSLDNTPMLNDPNKIVNSHLIAALHSNLFFSEPLQLSLQNQSITENGNNLIQNQKVGEEILIVALKGNEELLEQREEGFYNRLEAECIIGIVNSLMKEQNADYNNIRILVSTRAQEKILTSLSSQSQKISQIVKTLDKPFTQSYDFIIFSGTRSNAKGDFGECKDPAILSTLLQHTLHKFIFVGDIDLYSQDPTWRQFFLTSFSKKQIFFVSPRHSTGTQHNQA